MFAPLIKRTAILSFLLLSILNVLNAQTSLQLKFKKSDVFAGIEVGSKGVKMSLVEIGKNAKSRGEFNILKDTSVNTDFISFTEPTFAATLDGFCALYNTAKNEYEIPAEKIFTVLSSGVKMQAEKENKEDWMKKLVNSFCTAINEPGRKVEIVDVLQEARLSHLGIVPDDKRYNTFLIDIGSGNTKGGYFPYGNTNDFKLFQINWGTKSTNNAAEKIANDDNDLGKYNQFLKRVLAGAEQNEIIYAVNKSGAYPLTDNVAFSGGAAWAVATLMFPDKINLGVIPVTYDEVIKFSERIYSNYASLSPDYLSKSVQGASLEDKETIIKTSATVNKVFNQKALMAGTGLMLKIMRQFESVQDRKQFFLIKNGHVGWISAYVGKAAD